MVFSVNVVECASFQSSGHPDVEAVKDGRCGAAASRCGGEATSSEVACSVKWFRRFDIGKHHQAQSRGERDLEPGLVLRARGLVVSRYK